MENHTTTTTAVAVCRSLLHCLTVVTVATLLVPSISCSCLPLTACRSAHHHNTKWPLFEGGSELCFVIALLFRLKQADS